MKSRGSNSTPFKDNVVQLLSHSLSAVLSLSRSSLRSSPSSTLPPSLFCFGNRRCRGLHRRQGSLLRGSPSPAELAAVIAGCLSLPISVGNRRVGGHRLRRSPYPAELSLIIAGARGSPHSALSRRPAVSGGQITRRLVECVRVFCLPLRSIGIATGLVIAANQYVLRRTESVKATLLGAGSDTQVSIHKVNTTLSDIQLYLCPYDQEMICNS